MPNNESTALSTQAGPSLSYDKPPLPSVLLPPWHSSHDNKQKNQKQTWTIRVINRSSACLIAWSWLCSSLVFVLNQVGYKVSAQIAREWHQSTDTNPPLLPALLRQLQPITGQQESHTFSTFTVTCSLHKRHADRLRRASAVVSFAAASAYHQAEGRP